MTGSPAFSAARTLRLMGSNWALRIGVAPALDRLAVGLEAVAQLAEQFGDHAMAGGVPTPLEFLGQLADALAGPSQGGFRVAAGDRIDQAFQVAAERGVRIHSPLAAASG